MATFSLCGGERDRVEIELVRYERRPVGEYFDDNWIDARVVVSAGAFRGAFAASLLASEVLGFEQQLFALHGALKGTARFATLEEQVSLVCEGDGRGEIHVMGVLVDQPGVGNVLHFNFVIDQSYLLRALSELRAALTEFPVRGANPSLQRTAAPPLT